MNRMQKAQIIARQVFDWQREQRHHIDHDQLVIQAAYRALEFDMMQHVEDFHHHFNIAYSGKPRMLDFEAAVFRHKFGAEELQEWQDHSDGARFELDALISGHASNNAKFKLHLAGMLDALADLVYVTLGTAHLQGFDFRQAFLRVHRANMSKVANPVAKDASEARKMKISKPEGWLAPSHVDLIEDHAHQCTCDDPAISVCILHGRGRAEVR